MLAQAKSSYKKGRRIFFFNYNQGPLKIMRIPDLPVSKCVEHSIGPQRVYGAFALLLQVDWS